MGRAMSKFNELALIALGDILGTSRFIISTNFLLACLEEALVILRQLGVTCPQ
jgi:hypothetical protein